jgi:putative peptidoglycan lipid II flippase
VSLFGMSVAAAELPLMSSSLGTAEEIAAGLRERLARALRQVAFFVIPTVAGFLLFGRVLIAALYQTGHFGRTDSTFVWYVLCGATVGLFATTRGRVCNSAFYSLHDTRTPLYFAVARIVAAAGLGYLLAFPLRPAVAWIFADLAGLPAPEPESAAMVFGTAGITLASGISGWIEYLLLRAAIMKRIGKIKVEAGYLAKLWGSALLAGVATLAALGLVLEPLLDRFVAAGSVRPILTGIGVLVTFVAVYFPAAILLGVKEARILVSRVTHKLR